MKKILALGLAMTMVLSLAACGEKDTGDTSKDNAPTSSIEDVEIKEVTPYLNADEIEGLELIDGVNHTKFYIPEGMMDNSVDALQYMFNAMALAFGTDSMTEEELANINEMMAKDMVGAYNEVFMVINPTMNYMASVITYANDEGIDLANMTDEQLNELANSVMGSMDTGNPGDLTGDTAGTTDDTNTTDDANTTDDIEINANVSIEATEPNSPDTSIVEDVIDSVNEATDGAVDAATNEAADGAVTGAVEGATDDTAVVDSDDKVAIGDVYAKDDTKVIYECTLTTEGMSTTNEAMSVELNGYFFVTVKDGYVSLGLAVSNGDEEYNWIEKFARGVEIDATNEGTFMTAEESMSTMFEGMENPLESDNNTDTTETADGTENTEATDTTESTGTTETADGTENTEATNGAEANS